MADKRINLTWEQLLEASKGMLRLQVYMVHSFPVNGLGPVLQNIDAHLQHQRELEQSGVMLAAGPHSTDDESSWEGDGTFVIRATSLAHAREIASSDPMHKSGARHFKVRPWLINEGRVNLRVNFSSGKFDFE